MLMKFKTRTVIIPGIQIGKNNIENNLEHITAINHCTFLQFARELSHEAGQEDHRQGQVESRVKDDQGDRMVQQPGFGSHHVDRHQDCQTRDEEPKAEYGFNDWR